MRQKRHSRRVLEIAAEMYAPTVERRQHDLITSAGQMLDVRGILSAPRRAESMLERLQRNRDIDADQREAGEAFQRLYRLAHLDPLKAADLMREVRAAGPQIASGVEFAKRRVNAAMQVLGGHGVIAGRCAWYVLGDEMNLNEWRLREGWHSQVGVTPLRHETAERILVRVLGVLVEHFGIGSQKRC